MIFELNSEQKLVADKYRIFAEAELAPRAALLDGSSPEKANDLMRDNLKRVAGLGLLGLSHEQKYAGSDRDWITQAVAGENIALFCPSTYLSSFASACLFGMALRHFGSQEQKNRYLPGIIRGDLVGSCVLLEPQATPNPSEAAIKATQCAEGWLMNGRKNMITNAPIADVFLVSAFTDSGAGLGQSVAMFLVDRNRKGFSVSDPLDKMGYRGSPTADLIFENCVVPAVSLLGKAEEGSAQMVRILDHGRIGMAAASLGIARRCLEESRRYAREKKSGGVPIGHHQEVAFKMADIVIMTDLARLLLYKACRDLERQDPESSVMAACAKVFSTEAASQAANLTMQISGGEGYLKTSVVERLYRDAKLGEICWGTSERQRIFVGNEVLAGLRVG